MNRRRQRFLAAGLLIAVLPCGCQQGEDEEIRKYTVPKADAVYQANHVKSKEAEMPQDAVHGFGPKTPAKTAKPANAVRYRMIGAIVPVGAQTWFFKMRGPVSLMDPHAAKFLEFAGTLKFTGGKPTWSLPKGWRQLPGRGLRFATILVDPEVDSLELTVIPLRSGNVGQEQDILRNVNRWRGELSLPNVAADKLYTKQDDTTAKQEVRKRIINGQTVVLVSLVGRLKPKQPGAPPFSR